MTATVNVKVFTMVKDEVDIIEDWIIYHGNLFGFNNIYILDNFSTDGTWEKMNEFSDKIKIFRVPDYRKKGEYMRGLINQFCEEGSIAFPIDIDEFIVFYDKVNNRVLVDPTLINNYMNSLPKHDVYKANYINVRPTLREGHAKITHEVEFGIYDNYGALAKSFFNTKYYKGNIDHGNHINNNNYYLTNICLVHYHCRNLKQMQKKVFNNVIGLGYKNNIGWLRNLIRVNPNCPGNHHVKHLINMIQGTYVMDTLTDFTGAANISGLKDFFTSRL